MASRGSHWRTWRWCMLNREVKQNGRHGVIITRPIHLGRLEEPNENERFEVLWRQPDGMYDTTNPTIMAWSELTHCITDKFITTQATAPLVSYFLIPLQQKNWEATEQEYDALMQKARAEHKQLVEAATHFGKQLDTMCGEEADPQQQQLQLRQPVEGPSKQQKGKRDKSKTAAAAASKASTNTAGTSKAASDGKGGTRTAAALSNGAQAAKVAAAVTKSKAEIAPSSAADVNDAESSDDFMDIGPSHRGLNIKPATKPQRQHKKQQHQATPASASKGFNRQQPDSSVLDQQEEKQQQEQSARKRQKRQQQQEGQQWPAQQGKQPAQTGKQGRQRAVEKTYKGWTGRIYPAEIACKPNDYRLGTKAYEDADDSNGEFEVEAILDEVEVDNPDYDSKSKGRRKVKPTVNMFMVKWKGFELDATGWLPADNIGELDLYKKWKRGPKPAYYTAVSPVAAGDAWLVANAAYLRRR